MPFSRPTLRALAQQASADVAEATGSYVLLRSSPLAILAKATAGLVQGLYGYLDWIARMAVPWTAEGEFLEAWAALVGVTRKSAAAAAGSATFTGTPGSILPDGAQVARSSDGLLYLTTGLGTVSSDGTVTVAIVAAEEGATGNAVDGSALRVASAATGVNSTGAMVGPATGGADAEGDDDFRARMLERYREPPQGGAQGDYVRWAKEVPGVTRAWATPNGAGAGTVVVYAMLDEAQAANGGFPQGTDGGAAAETRTAPATGDQLTIADYLYPLQPVTALVYVVAPVASPINLTIADLDEDTTATRAAIASAVRGMLRRQGEPGGTIYQSDLVAAIDGVPGVEHFTLTSPSASVTASAGRLPTLGTITWA
ncbi:baseplate J/gp47 family protein [Pararoseomonas indoligenes]|uniref:Baseplate J/gp47 family protein n=1 Tax=Roseomonas indoligenes TaxID=2820811 RepID=A0A940MYP8_9PROT|nr:baseplate J/gp47 family protein [Pararoseomonas indoligenes]MBP0492155.1 baseplate J/gp47 family protein [Pararoseomonas indoligenes]